MTIGKPPETRTAWITISKVALASKPMGNSLTSWSVKHITLQVAKVLIVDLLTMLHISHTHSSFKSKPKDNGLKIWKLLAFSSKTSSGSLGKWVRRSKSRYWSVTCNRANSKESWTNSMRSCSNKLYSLSTTSTSNNSCNSSRGTSLSIVLKMD